MFLKHNIDEIKNRSSLLKSRVLVLRHLFISGFMMRPFAFFNFYMTFCKATQSNLPLLVLISTLRKRRLELIFIQHFHPSSDFKNERN